MGRELTESDLTFEELRWLMRMGNRHVSKVLLDEEGRKYIEMYTPHTAEKKERVYLQENTASML